MEEQNTNEVEDNDEVVQDETKRTGIMAAIGAALSAGNITSKQAKEFRQNFGVYQSHFTKKEPTRSQRSVHMNMQKESRKKNRGLGKGQKQSGRH